jgi:chemotaxis protein CheX
MLQTEVSFDKPTVKTAATPCMDVSCVIGFSGDATGCVVLCFANDVACNVAGKFAGARVDLSHPDFADALGELANMVAGNAKKDISDANITISLPNVVIGSNHSISPSKSTPHVLIPCKSLLGDFTVEVGMRVEKTASTVRPVEQGAGV